MGVLLWHMLCCGFVILAVVVVVVVVDRAYNDAVG